MANYLLAYKGGAVATTAAERDAAMAAWGGWFQSLNGAVVDPGNPFGPSNSVAPDGTVSEGAPAALTGYSVLSAESLSAATALAKECPLLANGGTVEIYETLPIM